MKKTLLLATAVLAVVAPVREVHGQSADQVRRWSVGTSLTYPIARIYHAWEGLNLEVELWPAYNSMHSSITNSRYPGTELWTEVKIGYKLDLYRNLFLQPAPGVGFGIFRTNRPPNFDDDIRSPSFAPQLILGVSW
jgi:hypothetical protein